MVLKLNVSKSTIMFKTALSKLIDNYLKTLIAITSLFQKKT